MYTFSFIFVPVNLKILKFNLGQSNQQFVLGSLKKRYSVYSAIHRQWKCFFIIQLVDLVNTVDDFTGHFLLITDKSRFLLTRFEYSAIRVDIALFTG